jgi:SAM-dependent methyltransferase
MSLVPLSDVSELLVCPRCRSKLQFDGGYSCDGANCALGGNLRYAMVDGRWPVLIDFEDSLVEAQGIRPLVADARSPSSLARPLAESIRGLVRPRNRVAAQQLDRLRGLLPADALVLVVGGGTVGNGAEVLYHDPRLRVVAFDIFPSEHVQLVADAHQIPLESGSVDAVVIQAVLEHVLDPWRVVDEIHRVLRPGGLVYAETPFMQQVHAGAYDFTRFSDSGHRWLFRRFSEVDRGVVAGPGTALSWSIDHLARALFRSRTAGQLFRLAFFWVRFADHFSAGSFASDGASAVFFLGRRSDVSISPREALRGYAGAQDAPTPVAGGGGTPSCE